MDYHKLLSELKNKQYKPVYFLHGEEGYFIDEICRYLENSVLSEAEKGFNQTILYGKDTDHLVVVDNARRYPMMSERQLVILKEAQDMKDLDNLAKYVDNPLGTTILVINYKHKSYSRFSSAFGKSLKKNAVIFESKKLYDNQLPDWITAYLKSNKISIQAKEAHLVAEYLGADLSKVSNELDKLVLNLSENTTVTAQHVEQYIGISKDYNIFEFQHALASRDIGKAGRIADYFGANFKKNPMIMLLGVLGSFFTKVYMLHFVKTKPQAEILKALGLRSPWFLKDYQLGVRNFSVSDTEEILAILREYDLKSKGVNFNTTGIREGELLREMTWKILHV